MSYQINQRIPYHFFDSIVSEIYVPIILSTAGSVYTEALLQDAKDFCFPGTQSWSLQADEQLLRHISRSLTSFTLELILFLFNDKIIIIHGVRSVDVVVLQSLCPGFSYLRLLQYILIDALCEPFRHDTSWGSSFPGMNLRWERLERL